MAAEDARYRQSTQYRLWSFSPAQLSAMREQTNTLARASISERLLSAPNTPAANVVSAPTSGTNTPDAHSQPPGQGPSALPEFLTPDEEGFLLKHNIADLLRAGKFIGCSTAVQATSAVFLRRFYVANSVMTYPVTELLKTCLFFGYKAEGEWPTASMFAEHFPKTTDESILAGEYLLCQGLRFAFDVKHPFRALEAVVSELRRYGDIDDNRIGAAYTRAKEILKYSPLMTDAYFHYTPSQIMLAALSLADHALCERTVHETFRLAHRPNAPPDAPQNRKAAAVAEDRARLLGADIRNKVLATVEACRAMLATEPPERLTDYWGTESLNSTKPLNRKLKKCRDPDRWDLVALQKARREQPMRKGDEDEEDGRPAAAAGSLEDDAAVFGGVAERDPKRRKVNMGPALAAPLGGPL